MKIEQLLPASGFAVVLRTEKQVHEHRVEFFALVDGKIVPVIFRDGAMLVATEGELSRR